MRRHIAVGLCVLHTLFCASCAFWGLTDDMIAGGVLLGEGSSVGPRKLASQGSYLYVMYPASFRVWNIADPSQPEQVAEVRLMDDLGEPRNMYLVGPYVYVGVEDGLYVFDVSEPESPQALGLHAISSSLLFASGGYGYAVGSREAADQTWYQVLEVIDLQDAAELRTLGESEPLPGAPGPTTVAVAGSGGCIITDLAQDAWGTVAVSLSDPVAPVFTPGFECWDAGGVAGVATDGGYAFVMCTTGALVVVDLWADGGPREATRVTDAAGYDIRRINPVLAADRLYALDGHLPGVIAYDVSHPESTSYTGLSRVPWMGAWCNEAFRHDDYLCVDTGGRWGSRFESRLLFIAMSSLR